MSEYAPFYEHGFTFFIMKKIILDMVGWMKVEDFPEYSVRAGRIDVSFHPSVLKFIETLAGEALTMKEGIPYALFVFTGNNYKNMPVFSIQL